MNKIAETYKGTDILIDKDGGFEVYCEYPIIGWTSHGFKTIEDAKKFIDWQKAKKEKVK